MARGGGHKPAQQPLFASMSSLVVFIALLGTASAGWPMLGFSATHSEVHPLSRPHLALPTVTWAYKAKGEIESSAVLNDDDSLVFAAGNNEIFAVHTSNGTKAWGFNAQRQVLASPALADGAIFIGADDEHFYALDQRLGPEPRPRC